ncbi:hypothetical protein, partial [Oceaniserpentilla sp. 4NH20-0058]|uniref:hypothetical protein n=1 Tax=Oceaniserpentilla sp. 4NH20-0058 TaxID=3127660 RepID=UPI0033425E51
MMLNAKLGMLLALVLLYGCSKSDKAEPQKSTTSNDDPFQPAIEPPVTEPEEPLVTEPEQPPVTEPE